MADICEGQVRLKFNTKICLINVDKFDRIVNFLIRIQTVHKSCAYICLIFS